MTQAPPDFSDADAVFERFLVAHERGDPIDVDELCRRHPALAPDLRALHHAWREVDAALDHASSSRSGPTLRSDPPSTSTSFDGLDVRRRSFVRYDLGDELGRGGMGIVRSVWDDDLERHLAMKTIRTVEGGANHGKSRTRAVGRFLEEARITGRLEHPGIVPIHELGVDDEGRLYFTMRRIEGDDLSVVFEKTSHHEGGWTQVRVLGVLLRACEAVAFAHDKNVVHRDLKPSNIMVGRFGETYVMDWGLARVMDVPERFPAEPDARSSSPGMTRDGDVLGTPAYMSPEQAAGDHDAVGPPSDVYSMGALLYQLMTGVAPYADVMDDGKSESTWTRARVTPPTAAARLAPDQPPELVSICEKAMARAPGDRYASMSALAADLRAFLEGRVVRAHRTGPWVEFRKWVVRNRALASTLLATIVLTVAGSITAAVVLAKKNETIREAQATAERRSRAATEAQNFLVDLFRQLDPTESPDGHALTARELLDRGAATVDGEVSDRETRARVLLWIGNAYTSLGHAEAAAPVLERAIAVADDHQLACAARSTLGGVLDDLGRTDEGFEVLHRALADAESYLGLDTALTNNVRANLAMIHFREGEFADAERLNLRALASDEARGAPPNPRLLSNLAAVYLEQRRFDEATEVIERALEIGRASAEYGPRHVYTLEAARTLGECLMATGRHEEAERTWSAIVEPYVEALGWLHPAIHDFVPKLACLKSELGRSEEGEELLRRMLAQIREELGDDHVDVAWVEGHLAIVVERLGHRKQAERLYRKALERSEREYGEAAMTPTSLLHNLVKLLLDQGRDDEARPLAIRLRRNLPHGTEQYDEMHGRLDLLLGPNE